MRTTACVNCNMSGLARKTPPRVLHPRPHAGHVSTWSTMRVKEEVQPTDRIQSSSRLTQTTSTTMRTTTTQRHEIIRTTTNVSYIISNIIMALDQAVYGEFSLLISICCSLPMNLRMKVRISLRPMLLSMILNRMSRWEWVKQSRMITSHWHHSSLELSHWRSIRISNSVIEWFQTPIIKKGFSNGTL